MIVSCTGHRWSNFTKAMDKKTIKANVKKWFKDNANRIEYHTNGMTIGFDQICAVAAIEAQVPVVAVLPCKNQEKYWSEKDKEIYSSLLKQCYQIEYISENHYNGCELDRNTKLVEMSDYMLTLRDTIEARSHGGTLSTIRKSLNKGIGVLNFFNNPPSILTEV